MGRFSGEATVILISVLLHNWVNSFRKEFAPVRVDLVLESFVVQGYKQEVTKVSPPPPPTCESESIYLEKLVCLDCIQTDIKSYHMAFLLNPHGSVIIVVKCRWTYTYS